VSYWLRIQHSRSIFTTCTGAVGVGDGHPHGSRVQIRSQAEQLASFEPAAGCIRAPLVPDKENAYIDRYLYTIFINEYSHDKESQYQTVHHPAE
jgi:hypothetical protein